MGEIMSLFKFIPPLLFEYEMLPKECHPLKAMSLAGWFGHYEVVVSVGLWPNHS